MEAFLMFLMLVSARPARDTIAVNVGRVAQTVSNYCMLGDPNSILPSMTYAPDTQINNYHLWLGGFILSSRIGGQPVAMLCNYGSWEWGPTDFDRLGWTPSPVDSNFAYVGPGKSAVDVVTAFDDFADNPYTTDPHLGVGVIMRTLHWDAGFGDLVYIHEYFVTYDSTECTLPSCPGALTDVMVGWLMDADVSGADFQNPHIDDWVGYDGWRDHPWTPVDQWTITRDTTWPEPDGIPDHLLIWGDDPDEFVLPGEGDTFTVYRNGTPRTVVGYLIPRNLSFILDGDDPSSPENDSLEGGESALALGFALLWAPPSSSDSVFAGRRMVRLRAHQWWDWNNDPTNDSAWTAYLWGDADFTQHYRIAPDPWMMGYGPYDYRFLQSAGPFTLSHGDTLKFVVVEALGYGLNGGVDSLHTGQHLPGLRQVMAWALAAFYAGSGTDPFHPDLAPPVFGGLDGTLDTGHYRLGVAASERVPGVSPVRVRLLPRGVFLAGRSGRVEVVLVDGAGRVRWRRRVRLLPGGIQVTFPSLPPGVFGLMIREGNRPVYRRMVMLP